MKSSINFDEPIEITKKESDKLKLIEFAQNLQLIPIQKCPTCSQKMKLFVRSKCPDGFYWRCLNKISFPKKSKR